MPSRFSVIVFLLFILVSCTSTKTPVQPDPNEQPLFTDVDLDKATVQKLTTRSVEVASEVSSATGSTVDKSADSGPITAQAVLPGATGVIAYIRYTPAATNPYSIILFDQATDIRTVVYNGKREIDSVAVDGLGAKVVFSSRQTISLTSDFEVYELILNPKTVTALTNNTSDDTNVSISADAAIIAWEGLRTTTATRQLQWLETATSTLRTLNSAVNDTMPSVSGNGAYLAFIRTLSTGTIRVSVYQLSNSTLTNVYNNTVVKKHPSVTDDKSKVAWTEVGTTTRVYIKDMATGIRTSVVANASGIEHAHLRKDGKYLTYGLLQSGKWQLYTRDLITNISIKGIGSTTYDTKGMFWAPSFLDTTFGNKGFVFTDFGKDEQAKALTIDGSGKLVVAGDFTNIDDNWDVGVVRYNANGDLDNSFGTQGKVITDNVGDTDLVYDIKIDNNGDILAAGKTFGDTSGLGDFIVSRYNANGIPDTSFDTDGVVLTDFGGYDDESKAIAIDNDGKIVVAGTVLTDIYEVSGSYDFGLVRYNQNGSLDIIGNVPEVPGLVINDFGEAYESAKDMVMTDDEIIVVGDHRVDITGPNGNDLIIARYLNLPTNIALSSYTTIDFAGGTELADDAIIDNNGKLVVSGDANDGPDDSNPNENFFLLRYNVDGSPDTSFGNAGRLLTSFDGGFVDTSIAVDSSGRLVVSGTTYDYICPRFMVARFLSNGTIDTSFGVNGKYMAKFDEDGTCNDIPYDIGIDTNGKIIVVGYRSQGLEGDNFLIARFNP